VCASWQSGALYTSAPYAAYSARDVNGTIGLYVGLSSFNVTLLGDPEYQTINDTAGGEAAPTAEAPHTSVRGVERINYNEVVHFGTRQGTTEALGAASRR
jgi:hypothetical protein